MPMIQAGADGIEHSATYFLARVLALKHFEVYVDPSSQPATVYTDHNPLVFVNHMRNRNQRIMRQDRLHRRCDRGC